MAQSRYSLRLLLLLGISFVRYTVAAIFVDQNGYTVHVAWNVASVYGSSADFWRNCLRKPELEAKYTNNTEVYEIIDPDEFDDGFETTHRDKRNRR